MLKPRLNMLFYSWDKGIYFGLMTALALARLCTVQLALCLKLAPLDYSDYSSQLW